MMSHQAEDREKRPLLDASEFETSSDDFIGNGSYAFVQKCHHPKLGTVAVKCFTVTGSKESQENVIVAEAERESKILVRLDHENIIKLHGITVNDQWHGFCGVIMEYAVYGNLEDLLRKEENMCWLLRLQLIKQMACGLGYLHEENNRIVHGDLKPQNIVLGDNLTVKIADFGSANIANVTGASKISLKLQDVSNQVTISHAAPECFRNKNFERLPSMDVYSLGMIMFEIITGRDMYKNTNLNRLLDALKLSTETNIHDFSAVEEVKNRFEEQATKEDNQVFSLLEKLMKSSLNMVPSKRQSSSDIYIQLNELQDAVNQPEKVEREVQKIIKKIENLSKKLACKRMNAEKIKLAMLNKSRFENFSKDAKSQRQMLQDREIENQKSLVLIGGEATMQDVKMFCPLTSDWNELPTLKVGRCHHSCAVLKNKTILAIGGVSDNAVLSSVEHFTIGEKCWVMGSCMNDCRFKAAAEVLDNKVYVFGGKDENDQPLNSVEYLPSVSEQWVKAKISLSSPRFSFSTFISQDMVFCCGGMGFNNKPLNDIEMYHLTKPAELITLDVSRYGASIAKLNDCQALLLGGLNKDGSAITKSVYCISYDDGKWKCTKDATDMKLSRCAFAAGVIGSTVYAVGGHGEKDKLSSLSSIERLPLNEENEAENRKWELTGPKIKANWAGHCIVVI